MAHSRFHRAAVLAAVAPVMFAATPAAAESAADFFKGKRLTYIVATNPGGGYDTYARLITKYMAKQLPVSKIIVKNVPGAGHIIGTNHVYAAKPDGLTIGTFNTGLIYAQIIGRKGIRFDLAKMSWIGKASADPRVFMVSKKSEISNYTELKKVKGQITVATSGVGSAAHNETIMLAHALGLNLKIIPGYRGKQAEMAMMRGEIVAQLGSKSSFSQFVKNGYGRLIFQVGGSGALPQAGKLATTTDGRALAALVAAQSTLARLTGGPAGIPAARLEVLVDAYKGALNDPALRKEARKLGRPIVPLFGRDVQKRVVAALHQSPEMTRRIIEVMNKKAPTATVTSALIKVGKKGRQVTFRGDKGKTVESKVSGSRTRITVAGRKAKRKSLKKGMSCRITYAIGGDNEAKLIACN